MGKTKKSKVSTAPAQPALYYSLHTLLETIRLIKVYEDPLCTLLHAIQTAGDSSPEVEQELQTLLDEMPSGAYLLELDGLRETLGKGQPALSPPKPPAPREAPRKAPRPLKSSVKRATAAKTTRKRV